MKKWGENETDIILTLKAHALGAFDFYEKHGYLLFFQFYDDFN